MKKAFLRMIRDKKALRLQWMKRRQLIPPERRIEASLALSKTNLPPRIIASFASFRDEIDTTPLNTLLAQKKSLALPKMDLHQLTFFLVHHLDYQLIRSPLGILEPIPSLCERAENLDAILVPGLAFDHHHYRLGYGKGYYDQFLKEHSVRSIGIGFKEQLTTHLPHDTHDARLNELVLL